MELAEIAPDVTLEDLKAVTEAEYTVADPLPIMQGTEEE
jgi:acyl CoA:acetate/3-ketoacid CoA transferase beta subunit